MMARTIWFLVLCLAGIVQGDFPNDLKRCKYGETKCIMDVMQSILREKAEVGDRRLDLAVIDPFPVKKLSIKRGGDGPIVLDLTFSNSKVYGIKALQTKGIKGFGKDLTQLHELNMYVDAVTCAGLYDINGKILILPITGKGAYNITLIEPLLSVRFTGKPYKRNGEIYMKPINFEVEAKPKRVLFNFENLFNGDKALGDTMNGFLNENWKLLYDELRHDIQRGLADNFQELIAKIFDKYPYSKFFQE